MRIINNIDIEKELESPEYKAEYKKHLHINNSLIRCLFFSSMNCSRSKEMKNKLFFLSVIDDILQSSVAIKMLATEGIRNTCRREMRYLIELSIKACYVTQKFSDKTVEKQIDEYKKQLKTSNITMVKDIDFYFFNEKNAKSFLQEIKRMYGYTCNYVHASPNQMLERLSLVANGRTIGKEGLKELKELNTEISKVYSYILVFLFHSLPTWCVGDYLVERDGKTVDWYFAKSKYIAEIDQHFDYKHERQSIIDEVRDMRNKSIEF